MKLLVLVTIALSNYISISFSGNTIQYQNLNSLPQTHDDETLSPQLDTTNNVDSFELIPIDNLLRKQDPSLTPQDLLRLRHQRGLLRAEALSSSSSATVSQRLFYEEGPYFMTVGVGTPTKNYYMLLDTASDMVWLQCLPCKKSCYPQLGTKFDPSNSSTFSPVDCGDPRCKQLQPLHNFNGCSNNNTCLYNVTYGDISFFSRGTLSTETLTLGSNMELQNIILGCGHDNQGGFSGLAGVLGLGRGNLSFITQTADRFQRQFSYCLAYSFSTSTNSYIVFGPSAVPTDQTRAAYTPLVHTNIDTLFYVNLTGISVAGTPVPGISPSVFDGGVKIDSGATYTQLVKEAYVPLRDAFRAAFQKQPNSTVSVGPTRNYLWFDTCYDITREMGQVEVPMVELHFDQGANMTLGPDNTMVEMYYDGTVATFCFAFVSSEWFTTIGNVQQQSIRIVYDLLGSRIGFVPEAC